VLRARACRQGWADTCERLAPIDDGGRNSDNASP
jgi:hypothetical protein